MLLLAGGAVLPPHFVTESAGPAFNTIGTYQGKPLVSVTGTRTYPTKGSLDMTTVYVAGGPNGSTSSLSVLGSWLRQSRSVYPADALYPPRATREQVAHQNTQEMDDAQSAAQVAVAKHLELPYTTRLTVTGSTEGAAAREVPKNAVLTSLDGKPLTDYDQLAQALAQGKGREVQLGYRTSTGQEKTLRASPRQDKDSGKYQLGLYLHQDHDLPFSVHYGLKDVGGPSAGLMFSLAIIDQLRPGLLTGGKHFAGTGTIDEDGKIGPIGGIQQKMIGARKAGATVFLAPAENCDEVIGHVPDGMQVLKVSTLKQADMAVAGVGLGEDPYSYAQCS